MSKSIKIVLDHLLYIIPFVLLFSARLLPVRRKYFGIEFGARTEKVSKRIKNVIQINLQIDTKSM